MARQEYTEAEVRSIMAAMQAEIDAATGLAAYRLEQMQADRKQALQWRDEVAAKPATDLLAQMKTQAQELPDERALPTLIGAHPDWAQIWNIAECVRLARIWTGYIDITKPDDHENYVPQWHVVMAVLLHTALTTGPQPATTGAALAAKPGTDEVQQ